MLCDFIGTLFILEGDVMRCLIVLIVLFVGADLFAEKVIRLKEDSYFLVKEGEDDRRGTTKEFVRSSETLEEWTELIRVQELYRENSAKKYVDEIVRKFKLDYPGLQFEMFNKVGTEEWGVDYLFIHVPPQKQKPVVEWTYFHAKENPGNKGSGVST
jgi:hypothetical protein